MPEKKEEIMLPIILAINNEDDRNFVGTIYDQYGKKIYKVAYKILNNSEDAEDCLHDVIKIIIDRLDAFRAADEDQLIKLLVSSTRNAAIDMYRKNKAKHINEIDRKPFIDDETGDDRVNIEEFPDGGLFADSLLINKESRMRITGMIEELGPIYRDVLFLRYQYSMKNQDIAKILQISESAVKVRYLRAKKILLQKRGRELDEMRKNG